MADDVTKWLEELGLGKYAAIFVENGIDFRALAALFSKPREVAESL